MSFSVLTVVNLNINYVKTHEYTMVNIYEIKKVIILFTGYSLAHLIICKIITSKGNFLWRNKPLEVDKYAKLYIV